MQLQNYIINDIKPLKINDTIGDLQQLFNQLTYSHIPIEKEGIYIGCIPETDAHCLEAKKIISDCSYTAEGFFVRNSTNWLDVLTPLLIGAFVLWAVFYFSAKYLIHSIEKLGRDLLIDEIPEIILNTKTFLWKTLINDWILAKDRKELILYMESFCI